MYSGLFGDLPAAKNSKNDEIAKSEKTGKTNCEENKSEATAEHQRQDVSTSQEGQDKKKRRVLEEPKSVKQSSLLQTVGVAGTSMAFVPTHINRKRQPSLKSLKGTNRPTAIDLKSSVPSSSAAASSTIDKAESVPATELTSWREERRSTTSAINDIEKPKDIHEAIQQQSQPQSPPTIIPASDVACESEELRQLHESVTDPYDPLVPNDLLQYWERQAAILERKEIEREARENVEAQIRMRRQLELERKELEKEGNVEKIVQHRQLNAMPGRGRGRGVSNLPAWLVEKQKKEAEMKRLSQEEGGSES